MSTFPNDAIPLTDSALFFGGKPRVPPSTDENAFIPLGHVSLDRSSTPSTYTISTFYISTALQGSGLGRAAMQTLDPVASNPPLNARTFLLKTNTREDWQRKEKWVALGRNRPVVSTQNWYERMEYVVYGRREWEWSEVDGEGRTWWASCVFR